MRCRGPSPSGTSPRATSRAPRLRRRAVGRTCARRLEAALLPNIEERRLGSIAVSINFPRHPDERSLTEALPAIADAIIASVQDAHGGEEIRLESEVLTSLRVWHWPEHALKVQVVAQPGGQFVRAAVDSFLGHRIPAKRAQTERYPQAIIAAFDRILIADPEDLAEALRSRADELPANWIAFYFICRSEVGGRKAVRVWGRRLGSV